MRPIETSRCREHDACSCRRQGLPGGFAAEEEAPGELKMDHVKAGPSQLKTPPELLRRGREGTDGKPRSIQSVGSPKELHQHLLPIPKALPRKNPARHSCDEHVEQAGITRICTPQLRLSLSGFSQCCACPSGHHLCVRCCSSLAILAEHAAGILGHEQGNGIDETPRADYYFQ